MRRLSTSGAARLTGLLASLAVVAAVSAALAVGSTGGESTAPTPAQPVLTLYALETELARAREELVVAETRRSSLAADQTLVRRQLRLARAALRVSNRRLADLVRALYEQDTAEPLAIVLGAGSLDDALTGLDSLDRATGAQRRVLQRAEASRSRFVRLGRRLDAQAAELKRNAEVSRFRLRALEAKAAERAAYLATLERRRELTVQGVSALEVRAKAAQRQTPRLPQSASGPAASSSAAGSEPAAQDAAVAAPTVDTRGRTLTVSSIGYTLRGRTASGLPTGPGLAAVDPSVIPLGTRMIVPGYGEAVAADTGGAVRGAVIDLWFPTRAAALRWGRRTVVITLR